MPNRGVIGGKFTCKISKSSVLESGEFGASVVSDFPDSCPKERAFERKEEAERSDRTHP